MKLTVTGSKNSPSFYVQKTIRKSDGHTTTVTIEKLGNIEEVRTKAKGMDPYVWAQDYVNKLNSMEYEANKSIVVPFSPSKLAKKGQQKSFNCGYLFLQDIYYSLGLDKICKEISDKHSFDYDLNDILSKLIYTRIIFPSSKYSSYKRAKTLIEQPKFELHDIYRALTVLAQENDFIQSNLYKNSHSVVERRSDILYYDCTNYYFEMEEEDDLRRYGHSKENRPQPIVGMGLFMDYDGMPLAFDIFPGGDNEQPTLKPLEQKIIRDYDLAQIIVCTDAGLSSMINRKFNDKTILGERVRSFITTQSVKELPAYLKDYVFDTKGWHLAGQDTLYDISKLDKDKDYYKIFYKDCWIKENLSKKAIKEGKKPLEQHLIVSFCLKYKYRQQKIRQRQIEKAQDLIDSGRYKKRSKNENDPHRFISRIMMTKEGETCSVEVPYIDKNVIDNEAKYDGFYAVCTNVEDISIDQVVKINKKRWEIEECFHILKDEFKARPVYLQREDRIKAHFLTCFIALFVYRVLERKLDDKYTCQEIISTLRSMNMYRPGEKMGWIMAYERTDLTDSPLDNPKSRTTHFCRDI